MENRLKEILSTVLDIPFNEISLNQPRNEILEWDSLAHIQIVVTIEHNFNCIIPFEDVDKIQSGSDFIKYINK